jgi:hypothetical protein
MRGSQKMNESGNNKAANAGPVILPALAHLKTASLNLPPLESRTVDFAPTEPAVPKTRSVQLRRKERRGPLR